MKLQPAVTVNALQACGLCILSLSIFDAVCSDGADDKVGVFGSFLK